MPAESMTPRQRWLAVLDRKPTDRLPMDYNATPEATDKLLRHLGCVDEWELYRYLHIDRLVPVRPRYTGPTRGPDYNEFGCRFADVAHDGGVYRECVSHPLAECNSVADVERAYRWPRVEDYDFGVLSEQIRNKEEYPVVGGGSEPFLTYTELRGLELAYRDLLTNPELVHHCLDVLFDLAYEQTRRIYERLPGRVDLSYVAEDFGSQQSLLFSPRTIRAFFLPRMKRMIDLAHEADVRVLCHSDGAIRTIIPDLIEIGIDVLDPVQWRCTGMGRVDLKRDFGEKLVFHGAVDNQHTLAFGTSDDVRIEVRDNIRVLGAGGGYIVAPCHYIQVISRPENIVAMYEAGYEHGWT